MGLSLTTAGTASAELVGPSCTAYAEKVPTGPGSVAGMAQDPVAVAASNNPLLTTLTKAVSGQLNPEVNLVDTLNGDGPFTIFAPTNDAFAALPADQLDAVLADTDLLTSILTYHVVAGDQLGAADLLEAGTVTTVNGGELTITQGTDGELLVNGVASVCMDVPTANATVHLLEGVLLPA